MRCGIFTAISLLAGALALGSCDCFADEPPTSPPAPLQTQLEVAPLKPIANAKTLKLPNDPTLVSSSAYSPFVQKGCFRWNGSTLNNALWLDNNRVIARGRFAAKPGQLANKSPLCSYAWSADRTNNRIRPALVTVQNGSTYQYLYSKGGARYKFLPQQKHNIVLLLRQSLKETSPTSMVETVIEDGHLDIYASPDNFSEAAAWLVHKNKITGKILTIRISLNNLVDGAEKKWSESLLVAKYHAFKKAYLLTPTDRERWKKKGCIPAWWLWMSGEIEEICIPPWFNDKSTGEASFPLEKAATRIGTVFQNFGKVSDDAGLYYVKNLRPKSILVGESFDNPSVSPDGCKVVFHCKRDKTSEHGALISIDVCRKFLGG
jgi:hypothetical protein